MIGLSVVHQEQKTDTIIVNWGCRTGTECLLSVCEDLIPSTIKNGQQNHHLPRALRTVNVTEHSCNRALHLLRKPQ